MVGGAGAGGGAYWAMGGADWAMGGAGEVG